MNKLFDLARMTTPTTGTGPITVGSAVAGFLTFTQAGMLNGDQFTYGVKDGSNSEIGTGVWNAGTSTFTRSVQKSTNSDNPINLSGSAQVFITTSAEDLAQIFAAFANAGNIGAWKHWRIRNIQGVGAIQAPSMTSLRLKHSGSYLVPTSVASTGASASNLLNGLGGWVGDADNVQYGSFGAHTVYGGTNFIDAYFSTGVVVDQITYDFSATDAYGAVPGTVRGFELWVSNDGITYFPLTALDLPMSGSHAGTLNLPTSWPFSGGSSFSGAYADLTGKPTLFSGAYSDLTGKPTIPTHLSDLADVSVTEGSGIDGYVLKWSNSAGKWEAAAESGGGSSLPTGGTIGQVLTKNSSTDGDAGWATPSGGGGGSVGSHRYWRMGNLQSYWYTDNAVSLKEIKFYDGATQKTVSSSYGYMLYPGGGGPYPTSNLFDGDTSTLWASLNGGSIVMDFGTAVALDSLQMLTREDPYSNQTPCAFDWSYSDDGVIWRSVATVDTTTATSTIPNSSGSNPPRSTWITVPLPTTL